MKLKTFPFHIVRKKTGREEISDTINSQDHEDLRAGIEIGDLMYAVCMSLQGLRYEVFRNETF